MRRHRSAGMSSEGGYLLVEGLVALVIIGLVAASAHQLHGAVTEARRSSAELRFATWVVRSALESPLPGGMSGGLERDDGGSVAGGPHVATVFQERGPQARSWQIASCHSSISEAEAVEGVKATAVVARRDIRASVGATRPTGDARSPAVILRFVDSAGSRLSFVPTVTIGSGLESSDVSSEELLSTRNGPDGLCASYRAVREGIHVMQIDLDGYVTRDHRPVGERRPTVVLHAGSTPLELAIDLAAPVEIRVTAGTALMNDQGVGPLRWSLSGDEGPVGHLIGERRAVFPGRQTVRVGVCGHAAEAGSMVQVDLQGGVFREITVPLGQLGIDGLPSEGPALHLSLARAFPCPGVGLGQPVLEWSGVSSQGSVDLAVPNGDWRLTIRDDQGLILAEGISVRVPGRVVDAGVGPAA